MTTSRVGGLRKALKGAGDMHKTDPDGVQQQSPGSPRSGAPWVAMPTTTRTLKGFHKGRRTVQPFQG